MGNWGAENGNRSSHWCREGEGSRSGRSRDCETSGSNGGRDRVNERSMVHKRSSMEGGCWCCNGVTNMVMLGNGVDYRSMGNGVVDYRSMGDGMDNGSMGDGVD